MLQARDIYKKGEHELYLKLIRSLSVLYYCIGGLEDWICDSDPSILIKSARCHHSQSGQG
jgi:hypothetical protein